MSIRSIFLFFILTKKKKQSIKYYYEFVLYSMLYCNLICVYCLHVYISGKKYFILHVLLNFCLSLFYVYCNCLFLLLRGLLLYLILILILNTDGQVFFYFVQNDTTINYPPTFIFVCNCCSS